MLGPGVELDALHVGRDTLHECRRGDGVGAGAGLVTPVGRGLPDPDLGASIPGLDARDPRLRELGVVRRADDLALRVELRHEERREVRLVPDREEADVRIAGVAAGVAGRDRAGEVLEVGEVLRHRLRLLAAVRPRRRAPQGDEHLRAALLSVPDELVDVPELVRRVEGVGRLGGTRRRHLRPVDDRPQDRRVVRARPVESVQARAVPAKHRVVVEADPHAVGPRCCRDEDSGCETREDEQADDETHVGLLGRVRDGGTVARPRYGVVRRFSL